MFRRRPGAAVWVPGHGARGRRAMEREVAEQRPLIAGLQALDVGSRYPAGIFQDLVVNTRRNLEHVRNSKTGSEGNEIELLANHFAVSFPWTAYKHNVVYKPNIKDVKLREKLLLLHEKSFGRCHIFDGNSLLLPKRLPNMENYLSLLKGRMVKITLQFSRQLSSTEPDCLRYYNIFFRRILKLMNLTQIGRNYYDKGERKTFYDSRVETWLGYVTSILPYEQNLTLCSDICHKVLHLKSAYDEIIDKKNKHLTDECFREEVSKNLVGLVVYTRYNNRTYRVDAINWDRSPNDIFKKSDGSETTFVQYYWQKYKERITDSTQPLLVSHRRWRRGQRPAAPDPILLVPQLCYLTGISKELLNKTDKKGTTLAKAMQQSPERRTENLEKFIEKIHRNSTAQDELKRCKVEFSKNFLPVSGRILKNVSIFQQEQLPEMEPQQAEWLKESRNLSLLMGKSLSSWILLHTSDCVEQAEKLLKMLRRVGPPMNITVKQAQMYEVDGDTSSYISTLQRRVKSNTDMVLCVLPDDEKCRYDEIKKYLCIRCPVPSQCVIADTLVTDGKLMSIATKIAQQMNCKMGGALWKVNIGLQKTMFIGIDCFHDTVNQQKSIAGFVSSTNEESTQWYSQCVFQETGQELVDGLSNCLEAALDSWFKNVHHQPDSVVVYRDGVGDGQLQALIDHEIPQLLRHLTKHEIKLTFIVVKKRINTRFFQVDGKFRNPPAGTVIDKVLTRWEWYDFYIVSQSTRHGTVNPTHYNVIYDTVCFEPDKVQCLTYKLCHMCYNFAGTIRVPAPCHYAHKLAYFVGQNIQQEAHYSLSNRLYYL
ncbi:piwi-like protein 3 [Octodon degus]|uniref:Piwi-like protein 3 n=1 Tax=Octodon degus TaxID=10160 RepID=A0A6P6EWK4_OCTDE|nr:piwi-like protein 3 [Octodon degus]